MSLGHTEPITQNTHSRSIQGKNLLDLISKPLGFRKSCKQQGISVRTGCRAGMGPHVCPRVGARNMGEGAKALGANSICAPAWSPSPCVLGHPWHPIKSTCNLWSEAFSSHQSLFCRLEEPGRHHFGNSPRPVSDGSRGRRSRASSPLGLGLRTVAQRSPVGRKPSCLQH